MKSKWMIYDILHSGRKGQRGTPCMDLKYKYVQGFCVTFDLKDVKPFQSVRMYFTANPVHKYWDTSAVIDSFIDSEWIELVEETVLRIETINAIYVLINIER